MPRVAVTCPHGVKGWGNCLTCCRVYRRRWKKRNRAKVRRWDRAQKRKDYAKLHAQTWARYIKLTYGLTVEEYNALLRLPCAICGAKSSGLDHDHRTGIVRAGLCSRCNLGLGNFRDDIVLLNRAIEYLHQHTKEIA